jgi:phosphoribosylaminoimidazole (AIR) synthetase
MFATFNMGIGMVLVVPEAGVGAVLEAASGAGVIGRVVAGSGLALRGRLVRGD